MDLLGLADQALREAGVPFSRFSGIQMNRSPLGGHCLALLIFTDKALPTAVLRVTTDPERAKTFKSAYENLQTLRAALPSVFTDSVPNPLLFDQRDSITLFLESAQHGTPIKAQPPNRYFRSEDFKQDFRAVVEWVEAFNTSLGVAPQDITESLRSELLNRPIADYRKRFQVSPALDALLSETEAVLRGAAVRLAPRHADFCTANVLMGANHTVQVIDWEQELTPVWPLCDLLHFMSSVWIAPYGRTVADQALNYRTLFFSPTALTALLQEGVRYYAQCLDIPESLVLHLSVMTWVLHALQKADYVSRYATSEEETQQLMARVHHITIIENNQCLNLEILAAERDAYIMDTP